MPYHYTAKLHMLVKLMPSLSRFYKVAEAILKHGFIKLSEGFRTAFPRISYSHVAKSKLLRMPFAAVHVGEPESGCSEIYSSIFMVQTTTNFFLF